MTGVTGARRGVGETAMSADTTVIETELLLRIVKCYLMDYCKELQW